MMRIAIIVLLTLAFSVAAPAQPLADRIPADAILYVGWAGADTMGPGYDGSHLKAMVEASDVRRVLDEVLPKIIDRIAEKEPDAREAAALTRDMIAPVWRHATALYVGPVEIGGNNPPMPRVALLCAAGNNAAGLEKKWAEFVTKADAPIPMNVRSSDGVVVLTIGEAPGLDAVISGTAKDKSLAAAKNFVSAMSGGQKSPVVAGYVDAEAIIKLIDQVVAQNNDPGEKWPAVRDELGLRGLKRVAFTQGFDGKDWGTSAFIDAPAPRKGLLSGFDAEPVSDAVLRTIPVSATMAGVGRLNLARIFDGLRNAVHKLEADAEDFDKAVREMNEFLGVDIRQDVLGALGDEWASYIAPDVGGRGPLGVVVVNRLKDEKRMLASSRKLMDVGNRMIAKEMKEENVKIEFKEAKAAGGSTVHYLATPFITPAWVVQNGNLYVGLYPQVAVGAAAHVSKEGKSILDNPAFVALRKRLGGEKAVSIQFYDLPRSAPSGYQGWLMISSFAKLGDVFGVDTPATLMPPLATVLEHMSVAGSVSWVDDKGWHLRGVSPFPGSTIIGSDAQGQFDVQTTAVMISVLLPSLNRAREQANRVKSASNLRQIGLACHIYANENRGKFPDDLAGTMNDMTVHVYVNPRTTTDVPHGLEGDALNDWVNQSSDYQYAGKGKTFKATSDVVLAYEKPERVQDGVNILFADGHVEFLPMPAAMEVIQKGRQANP